MAGNQMQAPDGTSPQRLEVLLADYQSCREDDRVLISIQAGLFSVVIALIGLMAAAVTQTCQFSSSKSCIHTPDYLLAATPLIPIALAAYIAIIGATSTLRSYYMRGLETEIRKYATDPISKLGEIRPVSFVGISMEVTSLRRGGVAFRVLNYLILTVVIMIFGGFTAYVGFHVGLLEQIVMSVMYGAMAGILIWQVSLATVGGRGYFITAAQKYLEERKETRLPTITAINSKKPSRNERSLASYLILPRPEDWSKWLIAPGVFLVTAWSTGNFSRWPQFILLWLILEYLIYEARYQWNDIRGIGDDQSHAESRARGRLPASSADKMGQVILVSLGVAATRLALAALVGWALGLWLPVLVLIATVFAIAVLYEALRAIKWTSPPTRATPTAIAIWLVVGLGYGVRSGLGFANAGYQITDWRFMAGISCFVIFGIMFVLMTWVLEAMSFRHVDIAGSWQAKQQDVSKGHAILLLKYVPVILGQAAVKPRTRDLVTQPDGTKIRILETRGNFVTPWNCALAASASLGGILGAALAHARAVHPAVMTLAIASLTFSVILALSNSQGMRITVVLTGYAVITAAATFFCKLPYIVLAGAPWLPVALLYLLFRGSSYRDLKDLGRQLHLALNRLVNNLLHTYLLLLRVIVGNQTWNFYTAWKKRTSTGAKP